MLCLGGGGGVLLTPTHIYCLIVIQIYNIWYVFWKPLGSTSIICQKNGKFAKIQICLRTQAIGITPRLLALSEGDGLVWKVKKFEFSSWNNFLIVAKRNNKEGLIDAIPPLLYIKWELSLKLYVNHQFTHRSLYRS